MSEFSTLYGGGSGAPIGTIISGNITDSSWLKLDNAVHNRASYPNLNVSKMLTFDGQSVVTGSTISPATYRVIWISGTTWYAQATSGTLAYKSTDNGATWTTISLPAGASTNYFVYFAGSLYFLLRNQWSGSNTYYTSTDGISWSARTMPSINGGYPEAGLISYISGRYIFTPTYASAAMNYWPALYSVDGINWTAISLTSIASASSASLYGGYPKGSPTISGRITLSISQLNGTTDLRVYHTADGLNWSMFYASGLNGYAYSGYQTPGPTGDGGYDAYGNWVDTTGYVWSNCTSGGNSPKRRRPGVPIYSADAAGGCNLWSWVGGEISEDHGISSFGTRLPGFNYVNSDFSGTRLLVINVSGVVSWIDVSPTKFRAVTPPLTEFEPRATNYYIKVS